MSMDVIKAIQERRSIRKYKNKKVDLIEQLIDAARLAPSGTNAQPSRYLVIRDSETKNRLRNVFEKDFVCKAPVIIVCCSDPSVYAENEEWNSSNEVRAIRDLAIASSFLVLRATELGLGTCYVGRIKRETLKNILGIPEEWRVPFVITVGYSAEHPKPRSRYSLDQIFLK